MQLTTVKELFKERDKYLNQEIQVPCDYWYTSGE